MAVTEISARANAAVDDLYRRHVGDVYRYSYAVLGNHADAEDVTQTTFVNALRALERGETPRDASRWLLVIAHNVVRQRWRQAAARPTLVELDGDVADGTLDAEEDVELEELVRALQRIPETQREALVMRELEGRSYREIAEVLAISSSALETLLFRARRSLAEELENVVTCQNAELVMSKQLDGRVSRKERKRLEAHLQECPSCTRLAAAQKRRRRAFKGLALLPLPLGLALFKGAPTASAATALPTIGLGSGGTGAAAASGTGGTAVGGSFLGAAAAKIAVAVVAATVATGVGYKGIEALRDEPAQPAVVAADPDAGPRTGGGAQPKPPVARDPVVAKDAVAGATAGAASGAKSVARVKSAVTATGSAATYIAPTPKSGGDGTSGPGAANPETAAAPVVPKPEKPKQAAPPPKAAPAPVQKPVAPPTPPATPPVAPPATPPAAPAAAVPAPPATPPAATQPPPVTSPTPPVTPPAPPVTPPVPTPVDPAPTDPAPPSGEDNGSDDQPGNGNGWGHHKGKHDSKHSWDS